MTIDPRTQFPREPGSFNEEFFDALVRHQTGLMRLSGSLRNRIHELLNATEEDLSRRVRTMSNVGPQSLASQRTRLLEQTIKRIRSDAWRQIDEETIAEMRDVAALEPEFVNKAVRSISPVILDTVLPGAERLRALVKEAPFELRKGQSKLLRDWLKTYEAEDLARITGPIRIGMTQGESNDQIARRIFGTAQAGGADGTMELTRRDAALLARTGTNHFANQARRQYFEENSELFTVEVYVATLDSRTTFLCASLDGQRFAIGKGPIPPLHPACRSLRVAELDGDLLGRRPAKASTERQLIREFSDQRDIAGQRGGLPRRRADLPRGSKGAYDEFARKRIRELTGTVQAKVTYQQWLERQTATFQDDIMGVTKGRLFRRGDMPLTKFVARDGSELTIPELARTEAKFFEAAGLDPAEFR